MVQFLFWIFASYLFVNVVSFESRISFSDFGFEYQPISSSILLLNQTVSNHLKCAFACYQYFQCQTFTYDGNSNQCQLFEGDLLSTGSIVSSLSSKSIVGSIALLESSFQQYNQTCDKCNDTRFLRCFNHRCDCHEHMFWNGSVCLSQMPIENLICQPNKNMCRADLGLTCESYNRCAICVTDDIMMTFDDLPSLVRIPNGYHNLYWVNAITFASIINPSGYNTATVSKNNTLVNENGSPILIQSVTGCLFTLKSLSVASAFLNNLKLIIFGYRSNVIIQQNIYTLQVFNLSNLTFSGYTGLNKVIFYPYNDTGTVLNPLVNYTGTYFGMDNIRLTFP